MCIFQLHVGIIMIKVLVVNRKQRLEIEHPNGPLEFGRIPKEGGRQIVVDDIAVSRDQLLVEELPSGRLSLQNLSGRVTIRFADGMMFPPGGSSERSLPVRLTVGDTLIEMDNVTAPEPIVLRLGVRPLQTMFGPAYREQSLVSLGDEPTVEGMAQWLERLVSVQLAAAGASDFYEATARAVVEQIGLDYGTVLLRDSDGTWRMVAKHGQKPVGAAEVSRTILERVASEKCTFYQVLPETTVIRSQIAGSAVVAAPVMTPDGQTVLGVVYGVRIPSLELKRSAIRPLEAQFVQVLASAVCSGLARIRREEEAAHHRQQFQHFFSPELAAALERNPRLLEGERRIVTILFCDIRNFSRISEQLTPEDTCELIRDVMERLTERIRLYQGVVVDYIGDAILAIWNAPADQPDHANLACEAALAMIEELPGLNASWSARIGQRIDFGIGLNTGPALVGNTGSHSRSKYGPLGHEVNLASRLEGATKQFGVPIMLSKATLDAIRDATFATRRLCQLQVAGMREAVEVYELHSKSFDPVWVERRDTYERGLSQFEDGDLAHACQTLHSLMEGRRGEYDRATLHLVSRAVDFLKDPDKPFDPILKLDTK